MPQPPIVRSLLCAAASVHLLGTFGRQSVHAESRSLVPVVSTVELDQNAGTFDANAEPSATKTRALQSGAGAGHGNGKAGKAAIGSKPVSGNKSVKAGNPASNGAGSAAQKKSSAETAKKAARRLERQPPLSYVRMRDSWHAAIQPPAELPTPPAPGDGHRVFQPLVLAPVNGGERVSVMPETAEGGFSPDELREAAHALSPGRRSPHPIAPHLLNLVYRTMLHFHAPLVHVISGYRADRAGSRHTQGRAIDFVIPGVSNEDLASYVQGFGFVGVGIYPNSGFVHLDVRPASFFWVDRSLPDEKCQTQQILVEESKRADADARSRGEQPDVFVPNNEREDKAASRAYQRRAQRKAVAQASRSL